MLKRTSLIGAMVVAMLIASTATAQTQKGQRRGNFGGQGGQPGGGGFNPGAMVLAMPEVQAELGLSEDQKGLIGDMLKDLRGSAGQNFQGLRDLSQEERRQKLADLAKDTAERAKKIDELTKTVLDAKQLERLEQLKLQREGVNALSRAEVAEKLGLGDEQKEKIRKIREESRPDPSSFQNLRNASKEDQQQAFAKARERREKSQAETLAVLTAEQKQTWEKMQGKKFDFPQSQRTRRPGGTGAGA